MTTLIREFEESLGYAREVAEGLGSRGQPDWGDPEEEEDRDQAARVIRSRETADRQTRPLMVKAKKRFRAIQKQIEFLEKEALVLSLLTEESEEVLDTLSLAEQQLRQDGFSSGESSEDEEEEEEEECEDEEEEEEEESSEDEEGNEQTMRAAAKREEDEQKRKIRDGEIELYEENGRIKERRLR
jgi:hypothetical protein